LCFVHEISHIHRSRIPGFEKAWNAIFGVPLLMPSFVYVGVHADHHSLATYGTDRDPEYLPFARSHWMTVGFLAHSVLIPLALLFRFFPLSLAGLLSSRLHRWLVVHASSLSMNTSYRRADSPALSARIQKGEIAILLFWLIAALAAWHYHLAWKALLVWYGVSAVAAVCNAARALGAHRYESRGTPLDRGGQLLDSIDTPGSLWSEIWAPVGLRYHALHHYFPGIPYHNLATAYRRLLDGLEVEAGYERMTSPSLASSLQQLYSAGKRARREDRQIAAPALVRDSEN
jgi:fatty acid desaturase